MTQLVCENLSLGYNGRKIVEGLSFEVNAGDYLCIVGENGSGKSTLVKTLLGLMPPLSGVIRMSGLTRREIGYLPQQTDYQRDFPATAREIVLSGFQGANGAHPFYSAAQKKAASGNMEKTGVLPLARRCYRELSGGQQQRVLLARALCAASRMLLLDEPVAGLDIKAADRMYEAVEKLNAEGVTVIMISHDTSAVYRAGSVLHIGKTLFFGSREKYLESEAFRGLGGRGK